MNAIRIDLPLAATTARLAALPILLLSLVSALPAQDISADANLQALKAAADQGNAKAQCDLGNLYETQRLKSKAVEYWRKSAEQGYAPAEAALGSAYGRGFGIGRNYAVAMAWYQKAADQGYPAAQFAMGNFYATGRGVTNDAAQAIQWWEKSAGHNYAAAEAALGEIYLAPSPAHGTNFLNPEKALIWLRRAAAHGSAAAMNNLGVAYETGAGVKIDEKKYIRWYREAAERGDAMAQASLGECYLDGRGVARDPVEAYKWFKLSALQGCFVGNKDLSTFSDSPLKPKELADAEQRVLDFHVKTDTNVPADLLETDRPEAKRP